MHSHFKIPIHVDSGEMATINSLVEIAKNLDKNLSPADILIDKYNNKWKKSIKPIYEEYIF